MKMRREITAAAWLPMHVVILPLAASAAVSKGWMDVAQANAAVYGAGFVYMLITQFSFLRSEFDALCDRPFNCLWQVVTLYIGIIALNGCMGWVISLLEGLRGAAEENYNNEAVFDLAEQGGGVIKAMTIFMAPVIEELIFRGGIFDLAARKSRAAAYVITTVLFCLYHVWAYALYDPFYWVYIIEYIPASLLLCLCRERTGTIWGSIFLHMVVNAMAFNAWELLAGAV